MSRVAKNRKTLALLAVGALALAGACGPAYAQAQQPAAQPQVTLEQRLDRMEEQLLDIDQMIGTLQSMAGNAAANAGAVQGQGAAAMVPPQAAGPAGTSPEVDQRVQALETQIGALTSQMERLAGQIGDLQAALSSGAQPVAPGVVPQQAPIQQGQIAPPVQAAPQAPQALPLPGQPQSFGTLTVQPGQQPVQQLPQQQFQAPAAAVAPQQPAAAPQQAAVRSTVASQAEYDAAFKQLVQRDFGAAEAGFREFLRKHPNDPLAGNAQYWLGETYYVRGQFRQAAETFLGGYQKYRNNGKAPANLLKLGMALAQLGQKDDACSTFAELSNKFPNAPSHLKQRAASERQRAGC